jgi:lia operon protein LiaG
MTIPHRRVGRLVLSAVAAAVLATPLAGQTERFTLTGRSPAVHNLAGEVTVAAGSGNAVVVEVTRAGADAGQLRVTRNGDAVRVVYPGDRIVYARLGARSRSTFQVRRDGTLGGGLVGARRVTVAGSGRGTRAHADVRVLVPAGRTVAVHQAVGQVQVTNVNGRVEVGAASAGVRAQGTRGELEVDVGSGAVQVRDAQGQVTVETGSGDVTLENVRGNTLEVSTGSGRVSGAGVRVETLQVGVGSGEIDLRGVQARDVSLETGSGDVSLGMTSDADLAVETGSGSVTIGVPGTFGAALDIDTGSGGITVDLPVSDRRASRGSFTGRVGDGNGRVQIETGSGGVRIRRN